MMNLGLSFTSDVITFDQNWHGLCSMSAGVNDLSNDTQIRVISPVESEICTKMLKTLSEKLRAKFPATTRGYSMVKIARLVDAFSEFFKLEASPVEGQSLRQNEKKRRKSKSKKKIEKHMPKQKCRWNVMLVERKACCHVANASLIRLELIWPTASLKISKMSKNAFLTQSSRSRWVNGWPY